MLHPNIADNLKKLVEKRDDGTTLLSELMKGGPGSGPHKGGGSSEGFSSDAKVVNGHEIKPNADLRGANLSLQDLNFADLRGANLSGAQLGVSELGYAYLMGADLTNASMSGADLRNADLTGADLRGADLYDADLRNANLTNANLSGADLNDANLSGADLTGARGLPEGFGKALAVKGGPGSGPHKSGGDDGLDDARGTYDAARSAGAEHEDALDAVQTTHGEDAANRLDAEGIEDSWN